MSEPKVYSGYTQTELEAAFKLVQPAENWKYPINAVVPETAPLAAIAAAVIFFTGSVTHVSKILPTATKGVRYRVRAAGYYATIGA